MSGSRDGAIGVFDSGVGGLSVWREIVALLPDEDTVYVADQEHCPYGDRPLQEIRQLSEGIVRLLLERQAKLVVVACNTVSAAALYHLRDRFAVPIVGMEPAVKPASERSERGRVGIMATPATFEGEPYSRLLSRFARDVEVIQSICPGLVERIEVGELDGPGMEALVGECLAPLVEGRVDVVVLGCTHYPFLGPIVEKVMGEGVEIIDPAPAVARQVQRVLEKEGLLQVTGRRGRHSFQTTGCAESFAGMVERLVGDRGEVSHLAWRDGRTRDALT